MSKEELTSELKELDRREYLIQMQDHLSDRAYDELRKIADRQREIKSLLETM